MKNTVGDTPQRPKPVAGILEISVGEHIWDYRDDPVNAFLYDDGEDPDKEPEPAPAKKATAPRKRTTKKEAKAE